eukprot:m.54679 g.54679  ORF g.54679 m.54679 type:complete len:55 (-) comp15520_c0_seq9:1669-1833(-)
MNAFMSLSQPVCVRAAGKPSTHAQTKAFTFYFLSNMSTNDVVQPVYKTLLQKTL